MQRNSTRDPADDGRGKGKVVFIPKIPLTPTDCPFPVRRFQFLIKLSFAMTINKAQGQSLKVVGFDLRTPCFAHGQFYVGC
uniref:ATP-dependent DNA helicase n=1 Tax=Octopus bimaculoides TaxID=37653 RepID=A0A0L8GG71_OCTBM